ncbi:MAG: RICIN domain-containing protein [Clostridia bacterium]|nr:RICIN domain-containing protein [Clostridia bacterium]
MKKARTRTKQILSVLLAVVMVLTTVPMIFVSATQDRTANFYRNYATSDNPGQFMVNIALAQLGRSTSSMGYTEAWCANFVSDCARLAGQSDAIPAHAYVPTLWNNILNAGGREVYDRKVGDIIFYDCPSCDTDGDGVSLQHVGIVIDGTYSVEGNYSSSVKKVSSFTDSNGHTTGSGKVKRRYLRPNYTTTTAPTYADLGDDFWAYIGNQGCEKWVAGQGTNVQGEACTGDINQMWHFIRQENGSYCILCLSNSYAMDVSHGSSNAGSNLQLMPYVANAAQQFFIYYKDNACYFKASYANLWVDMDQSTFNVAMWNESNDYAPQKFNIQKIDYKGYLPQDIGTDFYAIIKNSSTGKWLTDRNYNVQGEDAACAYNQIWHFVRHGDRCYSMLCNTSNAMDVSQGSSTAGTNLQIMPYVANAAQRFYIYYKDGGYYFKSSYSDLMIDMDQSDFSVSMWNCNLDYPPQKFEIIKVNKDFTHTWNSGSVTKAATCTATGVKTYTCTVCNGTKTETISINANNHVNTKNVAAVASTCTVKGYTAGVYCNDCKKYINGHAEQPLAAHQTTLINAKAATYDATGYTGDQYCAVCKQTITYGTVIPKLTKPDEPTNPTQPTNPAPQPQTQPSGGCAYCGQTHTGFPGILIGFFHSILALFGLRK